MDNPHLNHITLRFILYTNLSRCMVNLRVTNSKYQEPLAVPERGCRNVLMHRGEVNDVRKCAG
jgi:hypothetical protein